MSPKRMQNLLKTEGIVLNQVCKNINEINRAIFNMIGEFLPPEEFMKVFKINNDGNFRMQPTYQGEFFEVAKVLDNQMQFLLEQRDKLTREIAGYVSALSQDRLENEPSALSYEAQGREYETVNRVVRNDSYATSNMQSQAQPVPHFAPMEQSVFYSQPVNSSVYDEEHTQGKTL